MKNWESVEGVMCKQTPADNDLFVLIWRNKTIWGIKLEVYEKESPPGCYFYTIQNQTLCDTGVNGKECGCYELRKWRRSSR